MPRRLVPLSDAQYFTQLEMMIATLRIPLERSSEKTGRTERVRLWDISDRTARTWLNVAAEAAALERSQFFGAGHPAHLPTQLRHAHAVRWHAAQGAVEPARPQELEVDGDLYAGVFAGRRGAAPGAVSDAGQ